eukprot:scaffold12342_cov167-Skeletonema_marinoi.AAC.1
MGGAPEANEGEGYFIFENVKAAGGAPPCQLCDYVGIDRIIFCCPMVDKKAVDALESWPSPRHLYDRARALSTMLHLKRSLSLGRSRHQHINSPI